MLKRILSALAVFALLSCALVFPALADDAIIKIETEIENDFIPDHLQTDTQRNITRGEFCTTLVSLYEYISKTQAELPSKNPFTDTDNPGVLKAYQLGIVQGIGNGLFMPGLELNVEQKAVMLYKTLILLDPSIESDLARGNEGSHFDFNDAGSVSAWAVEAIEYLYHHGIINEDKDQNINPIDSVTVDSANFHAQVTLEHYNDLTTLSDDEQTQLLGSSANGTLVIMSSGVSRTIDKLEVDDEILAADSSVAIVTNVTFSRIETVIKIIYGDRGSILVSKTQPLLTDVGLMQARDLNPGNKLIDKGGNPVEVKYIYEQQYNDIVIQIDLGSAGNSIYSNHLYVAYGIVVGDLTKQHELQFDRE